MRNLLTSLVLTAGLAAGFGMSAAQAQLLEPSTTQAPNPLTDATVKPGKMILFDLEARFAKDVLERGGAAFADWFADDGVALGNAAAPLVGKVAIVKSANWLPQNYQLTWTPTDGMMGPSGIWAIRGAISKGAARIKTATPSSPAAATSPCGASSRTATGRSCSTPAPASLPMPGIAASCPDTERQGFRD